MKITINGKTREVKCCMECPFCVGEKKHWNDPVDTYYYCQYESRIEPRKLGKIDRFAPGQEHLPTYERKIEYLIDKDCILKGEVNEDNDRNNT